MPRNYVSQKPYRGINVFLLLALSYESPLWLTFRQVSQLGGSVKKGEKACPVVFWKQMKIENKESGEQQKIPLLRYYHVFNVAQCDGLKTHARPMPVFVNGTTRPDAIVANVRLSAEQRTRHTHIIGASGTGKSTLLFNLIRQDIENGEGVALPEPVPEDSSVTRRGYKVKSTTKTLTDEERQQREALLNKKMAEAMRPKK